MTGLQIGRIVHVLRQRAGVTQLELARRARVSQSMVSLLERGHLDRISLPMTRRILAALEADMIVVVRWRGGELDRLLDERHAGIGEGLARLLSELGWDVEPEVTYSVFGERCSIDLLAWHASTRTLLVIELKSELTSIEQTLRKHDEKVRLAGRIAAERFGWRAATVTKLLVLPDTSTARRQVERHAALMGRAYPNRNREVRAFLRRAGGLAGSGRFSGLMFLSFSDQVSGIRSSGPRKRVRSGRSACARA